MNRVEPSLDVLNIDDIVVSKHDPCSGDGTGLDSAGDGRDVENEVFALVGAAHAFVVGGGPELGFGAEGGEVSVGEHDFNGS